MASSQRITVLVLIIFLSPFLFLGQTVIWFNYILILPFLFVAITILLKALSSKELDFGEVTVKTHDKNFVNISISMVVQRSLSLKSANITWDRLQSYVAKSIKQELFDQVTNAPSFNYLKKNLGEVSDKLNESSIAQDLWRHHRIRVSRFILVLEHLPETRAQITQLLVSPPVSEIYQIFADFLRYETARELVRFRANKLAEMELESINPQLIKRATSILIQAQDINHGAEVFLIYDLLSRSVEAKFVRDIIAINPKYSQVANIKNPAFLETISTLKKLTPISKVISRSEKAHLAEKLPYYAQVIASLDRLGGDNLREYSVEQDAINQFIIPQWKNLLLDNISELSGRALIQIGLDTEIFIGRQPNVILILKNKGDGIAENVQIQIKSDDSEVELEPTSQSIDLILPNTETKIIFETVTDTGIQEEYRLAFDITFDDLERTDKAIAFADTVSFTEGATEFQELFPIPYVTGPPVKSSELFVGRDEIFEFVLKYLPAKSRDNIILLHGERRTGKTSILHQLQQKLPDQYVPVLIDLQGMIDPGLDAFLYDLAKTIFYELEDKGFSVVVPEIDNFQEGRSSSYFRHTFLKDVTRKLGNKRLALMVDEFGFLEDRIKSEMIEEGILDYLRHLMQHQPIDFIFAGTYDMAKSASDYWSFLFNIAQIRKIELLDFDQTKRLILEPVRGYFSYDDYASQKIWQVTKGHPYFVQLLCHNLIQYGNKEKIPYFTIQHVEDAIVRLVQSGDNYFGYVWKDASKEAQVLMRIISDLIKTKQIAVLADIRTMLDKYGIHLNIQEEIQELTARGIIEEKEGCYFFKIGLIGEWIHATRSIKSLV